MSCWSHVAGIVRIDGFGGQLDADSLFGKQLDYYDDEDVWEDAMAHPDRYLPMGSEGSLKMFVWTNPNSGSLARFTVSIFGDLRDSHDGNEIVEWFKKKVSSIGAVRNAVIVVQNDVTGLSTWAYEG